MRKIETKKAPGAIGPYSQAFETNGFVITSGRFPSTLKRDWFLMASKNRPIRAAKTWQPFWKRLARAWKKSSRHLLFGGYEGFCRL